MYALEDITQIDVMFCHQKLIVTRLGAGPSVWNEQNFINTIFNSLL